MSLLKLSRLLLLFVVVCASRTNAHEIPHLFESRPLPPPTLDPGPDAAVLRIKIVDAATLDVPGLSGQVANVIVRSTGISGQWAYRPEFRSYYTDPLFTRFEST